VRALDHAKNLSANQQRALVALLSSPTIQAAARSCGLGESTVRKYLSEPNFAHAYAEERERLFSEGIHALQQAASKAVDVFVAALEHEDANVRLRAARSVWEHLFKGVAIEDERKLLDLARRIEILEAKNPVERNGKR